MSIHPRVISGWVHGPVAGDAGCGSLTFIILFVVNVSVYILCVVNKQTHSGFTGYTEHSTVAEILGWIGFGQLWPAVSSAVLRPDGVDILTVYILLCCYLYLYMYFFICSAVLPRANIHVYDVYIVILFHVSHMSE